MGRYGKWVGGGLGWAFGGPIGALVGFSLGYLWDNATLEGSGESNRNDSDNNHEQTHPGDFALSLLVLAAAIMKADQRILKSELNFVKAFLIKQFGQEKAAELLKVLRDVLDREINLVPVCLQIKRHMSHSQRLELVHFLLGIANADGQFHSREAEVLSRIAGYLNVNAADLRSMTAMYDLDNDRYYRILEIDKKASQEEIKSAYRRMAKKYHPDRLGNVGEDVKASAAEKFLKVQEAYEKLYKG